MKYSFTILFALLFTHSLFAQLFREVAKSRSFIPDVTNILVGPGTGERLLDYPVANTFVGYYAGNYTVSGYGNNFLGYKSGYNNDSGNNNNFIGYQAGFSNVSGSHNNFIGILAGYSNTKGTSNIFIGAESGYYSLEGDYNIFVGNGAGRNNIYGSYNNFIGNGAGSSNFSGTENNFLGNVAGFSNTTGYHNNFIGRSAGQSNTTGGNNNFIGSGSGYSNTTAKENNFFGFEAGHFNTTGEFNNFFGANAGYSNSVGNSNIFIGDKAGLFNFSGSKNIIIGPFSGTAITSTDNNVLIGYNSQADNGLFNATALGANSRVTASNALILGDQVNVGIGTSAPTARLEIVSQSENTSGLRLTSLIDNSPVVTQTDQFLTVDHQGNVVKARYQLRIQDTAQWSDKVFRPGYSLKSLPAVEAYIQQHGHLPDMPSADEVAEKGVDLVKMNALLLQKIEELTLHTIELQKQVDQLKNKKDFER
ncbi:hypothetical protein [Spirosoma panaciterrae]|uniref:hypothetical protein n=1 Tax=Spirosoma panaciterrae TaxID=496058 RepID=UPI00036783C4|nr:hypothetical protein [Spirosoma panaciterrae]